MEYDYEHEDDYSPRVLWGRIAAFAVAAVLVFLAGRCTKGTGVSVEQFKQANKQVLTLTSENAVLEQQLAAAQSRGGRRGPDAGNGNRGNGDGDGDDGGGRDGNDGGRDPTAEVGQTYTVKSGDTLGGIAEDFYGDRTKFRLIAEANNLTAETQLQVGQQLTIPPEE